MNEWLFAGGVAALAMLATAGLTPLAMVFAHRLGVLDQPEARKVHERPTPRTGGIAIAGGVSVAAAVGLGAAWLGWLEAESTQVTKMLLILVVSLFVFAVGLADDVRTVSSRFKTLVLIGAGMALCSGGVLLKAILFGELLNEALWFTWPSTILWVLVVTVAVNFIDGLDGLAAGLVALAGAVLSVYLLALGQPFMAIVPLALTGALAGFLIFNTHPARVFMGDSGSMFIGVVVGASMIWANGTIGTARGVILPALALSIPLLDTAVTMYRRKYMQRRSIFSAERGHIHHHLLDRGLSHRSAVVVLYAVSIAVVLLGALSMIADGWSSLGGFSLIGLLLWGTFRFAGSVRTSEMLEAFHRKRRADGQSQHYHRAFEAAQLDFRKATEFHSWWQACCRAAEGLDLHRLTLEVAARDGSTRELEWTATDAEAGAACMSAVVPMKDRRDDRLLHANVEVAATHSLESAGHRVALFSRLMADHGLYHVGRELRNGQATVTRETTPRLRETSEGDGQPSDGATTMPGRSSRRVAIVHDFLYTYAGAERVLEQMINEYPEADLFSLFDFLPDDQRDFIRHKPVNTTLIQKMPLASRKHRAYLPMMPLAIEQLDLSGYDLVISSSHLVAKGVITGPEQMHVCYCHSPARFAWDLQHEYLSQANIGFGPKGLITRSLLHYLRAWDIRSAMGVDSFISNSEFIARRIHKVYRRRAKVIYPPVDTSAFTPADERKDYYITASRLVPYKRIDLLVEAFNRMPHRRLLVIGDGPEREKIESLAGPNVSILGYQSTDRLRQMVGEAKAFMFAAEEDFGIVPVEAMAAGTPVIAYGAGGACETVVDGQTGLLFDRQHPAWVVDAVERFERQSERFDPAEVEAHAERFSIDRFRSEFRAEVESQWERFRATRTMHVTTPVAVEPTSSYGHANDHGQANGNGHAAAPTPADAPADAAKTSPPDPAKPGPMATAP